MIVSVGVDMCKISRIKRAIIDHGLRFLFRIYTKKEREYAESISIKKFSRYAQFFSVKEACAKAIGTGIRFPITFRDIETRVDFLGKPHVFFSGYMNTLMQRKVCHLSLSDENDMVIAFIIIEEKNV